MFRRDISLPSSGKSKLSIPDAFKLVLFSAYSTLKMELMYSLEMGLNFNGLHCVMSQNTLLFYMYNLTLILFILSVHTLLQNLSYVE
jgi:hypothetical protein